MARIMTTQGAQPDSGQGRARTADTGLFRAVLYQLSYLTVINNLNDPDFMHSRSIRCLAIVGYDA